MMRNKWRKALCVVLALIAIGLIASAVINAANRDRMLHAVGLENAGLKQVDYTYFYDLLNYVDGWEIMAFTPENGQWTAPEHWIQLDAAMNVDDLAGKLGISVNTNAILNLSLGGETCISYCFADNRAGQPFDAQEYYLAYCDDTHDPTVFIYRGHHLYGI